MALERDVTCKILGIWSYLIFDRLGVQGSWHDYDLAVSKPNGTSQHAAFATVSPNVRQVAVEQN
jgi:hypothetical protein